MGLDMYLYGIMTDKRKDLDAPETGSYSQVAYWRKANQVHKWFSVRFIKKQDPWGTYRVSRDDIIGLLLTCKLLRKIKNKEVSIDNKYVNTENFLPQSVLSYDEADFIASVLLPPDNIGCFFGSGIVDEGYWEQIDDTIDMLTKALDDGYHTFFYEASW